MFQRVSSCQSRKYCISKYCATGRNKVRSTLYITYQLPVTIQNATLVPQKVSRKEENRKERRKTKTMPGRNWRRGRGGRGSRGRGGGSRRFVRGGDQGPSTDDKKTELAESTSANFREDTSGFFTKNISFDSHVKAQTDDRLCYCATIRALEEWQVDIPQRKWTYVNLL